MNDVKITTRLCIAAVLCFAMWSFRVLRENDANDESSINCVRNEAQWVEPHGISPGFCRKKLTQNQ